MGKIGFNQVVFHEKMLKHVVFSIRKNCDKPMEIKHVFGLFVINALWRILAGDKFSVNDARIQELYRLCIE